MKTLAKLNIFSALYALVLLIEIEPMVNIYRISRATNWPVNTTNLIILIFDFVVFVSSTILFFQLTRKHLNTGKIKYLVTLLWIPYLAVFICVFTSLFPMTNPGDDPAPVEEG